MLFALALVSSLSNECRGVNSGILAHAEKLSNDFDAYVVVPDLYKGKIGVDKEEASHIMNEMDFMNVAKEIG